jgi:hypothetical protein
MAYHSLVHYLSELELDFCSTPKGVASGLFSRGGAAPLP